MPTEDNHAVLEMSFEDENPLTALNLSAFFYDLNRVYVETYRLALETGQDPPPKIWGRYAFILPNAQDQLAVHRIRFESPGWAECIGIIGVLIQTLTLIVLASSWKLNRDKTLLEIEKLRRELGVGRRFRRIEPTLMLPPSVRPPLDRLRENPLKPNKVALRVNIKDAD